MWACRIDRSDRRSRMRAPRGVRESNPPTSTDITKILPFHRHASPSIPSIHAMLVHHIFTSTRTLCVELPDLAMEDLGNSVGNSEDANMEEIDKINDEVTEIITYDQIMDVIDEEERRLNQEHALNEDMIPKQKKRGVSSLSEDKEFMKFMVTHKTTTDSGTFLNFIEERRNEKCLKSILNQCAQFVTYVKSRCESYQRLVCASLIETVVCQHPAIFHDFLNNLLRDGSLQPSTVQNRIDSLQYLIEWCRCNCNTDTYFKYSHVIERLKEERGRFQSINRKKARENSIDKLIKKRMWVEDGVAGLQNIMLDSWRYFDALVCLKCYMPLSRARYTWALSYALASMWCLCINARVKSIEQLTMKGFKDLEEKKYFLSTTFKTSSKYHYQVIEYILVAH